MLDAAAVQRDHVTWLRTRRNLNLSLAVERLELDGGAQSCRRHRQRHGAVQVVALALEHRVRPLDDLDVEVASRTTARADLALTGELNARARVHTAGDLDLQRTTGADAPFASALHARVRDDRAEAHALRAGTRRHHLAEE